MKPRDRLNKLIHKGDRAIVDLDNAGRVTGLLTTMSICCTVLRFTYHGTQVVVKYDDDIGYIDPDHLTVMTEDQFVQFKLGDPNWQGT